MPIKLYPWDQWFRRKKFTLRRRTHYYCSPSAMAQQIRNQAARRGVRVSIAIDPDDRFTVSVVESEAEREALPASSTNGVSRN